MSTPWVFLSIFWIQEPHPQLRTVAGRFLFPAALLGEVFELGSSSVDFPGIHLVNRKTWQPYPSPRKFGKSTFLPLLLCLLVLSLWASTAFLPSCFSG